MITTITIKNLILIRHLHFNFNRGLNILTGETGAGKSILLKALALALGAKTQGDMVRIGADCAEIKLVLSIPQDQQPEALKGFQQMSSPSTFELVRQITPSGKSKQFLNGQSLSLSELKHLTQPLVQVHSQHAHQALVLTDEQLGYLDLYCRNQARLAEVKAHYLHYQHLRHLLDELEKTPHHEAEQTLLQYQLDELQEARLEETEWQALNQAHKTASAGDTILKEGAYVLEQLQGDQSLGLIQALHGIKQTVNQLTHLNSDFTNLGQLIDNSLVHLEEASLELRQRLSQAEVDPEQLAEIEARLQFLHHLARKHKVNPEQLFQHYQNLLAKQAEFQQRLIQQAKLTQDLAQAEKDYHLTAHSLSEARQTGAKGFAHDLTNNLIHLGIGKGECEIRLVSYTDSVPRATGQEQAQFWIKTNIGQPFKPLAKIASGGELSRISLAIRAILAQQGPVLPTLIFDEVDVGIGGDTALKVAQLLKQIAFQYQVLCITHLPQIAVQGQQHFFLFKEVIGEETQTQGLELSTQERVKEIARMLGGDASGNPSLAHARAMLAEVGVVID